MYKNIFINTIGTITRSDGLYFIQIEHNGNAHKFCTTIDFYSYICLLFLKTLCDL